MDWVKIIITIKEKLLLHGYKQTADRITYAQMSLGTPGEMYLEVMNELLVIKKQSAKEYELIRSEMDQLLDYGKSIEYFSSPED